MVVHSTLVDPHLHYPLGAVQTGAVLDLAANNVAAFQIQDSAGEVVFDIDTTTSDQGVFFGGTDVAPGSASLKYKFYARDNAVDVFILSDDNGTPREYMNLNTTNGSEELSFGNSVTNPIHTFVGTNDVRLSSQVRFDERSGDPTPVAGTGFVYTKDVSAVTELFYESSDGTVTQISGGGGGGTHSVTGDGNVIIEDSATTRAYLTANMTSEDLTIGNTNAADRIDLILESPSTDPSYIQFGGGAARPIIITGPTITALPTSINTIHIGNSPNHSGTWTNVTVAGNNVRVDGIQATGQGYNLRLQANDSILGGASTSTNASGNNAGVGRSLAFTGTRNAMLGAECQDILATDSVVLGYRGRAANSGTNTIYAGGLTEIRTLMMGTGGSTDNVDATVTLITPSPKSSLADRGGIMRLSGGGSTGLAGTTLEIYAAATNFATGTTQHAAQRVAHFEMLGTTPNPGEFGLHIGDEGAVTANDAYLYFDAGDGGSAVQASFFLDGATDDLTISLPTSGQLLMTDRAFVLTQSTVNASVLEVALDMATATLAGFQITTDAGVSYTTGITGMDVRFDTANSINTAGSAIAIQLIGQTNAGAGSSIAINVGSGWDIGFFLSSGIVALSPTGNYSLTSSGTNTTVRIGLADDTTGAYRITHTGFTWIDIDTDNGSEVLRFGSVGTPDLEFGSGSAQLIGFHGATPVAQSAAYTRNATVVESRTLLASASATTTNNNNVLAALIADFQAKGLLG